MEKNEFIKLSCDDCKCNEVNHKILRIESRYNFIEDSDMCDVFQYAIVECCNCGKIKFACLHEFYDECIDGNILGKRIGKAKVICEYSPYIKGLDKNIFNKYAPETLSKLYFQVKNSVMAKDYILATVGIRLIIEFICKAHIDKNDDNFCKIINELCNNRIISNNDKDILHILRKLGNKSAHEFFEPNDEHMSVLMSFIDGLIEKQYKINKSIINIKSIL